MATNPKDYWKTYERKSAHVSGAHSSFRRYVTSDWTLLDAAATGLGMATGTELAIALVELIAHNRTKKLAALCSQVRTGGYARASTKTRRWVRHDALESDETFERVRQVFFELADPESGK